MESSWGAVEILLTTLLNPGSSMAEAPHILVPDHADDTAVPMTSEPDLDLHDKDVKDGPPPDS
jgi:hypothetical protein